MFKRSALALASILAGAALAVVDCVTTVCAAAYERAAAVIFGPALVAPAEVDADPTSRPVVALRRASDFVLRLLKRERPEVTPTWRMVPST